ncbi:hypothetical protein ACKKBG_A32570 [Auxenochlorella protothecoides x Auxenochlorella symbiontica]|uniref:DnaJ-like protein subfamily C member 24 n=1 Tax=Auxenochlorella protothecoides TaxID=3075 RepID=A0A087SAD0_AUXPR|nr:DnaJ-like protein subfamily C member 24 [Auxenochlorella protothecoides]KFM22684.1 DnaJ-like protein subfamily C member 24 [Auxenochlorella protothecoides]
MTAGTDPYAVLGVDPSASQEALRAAFRAAVLRLHPDKAGPGEAAAAAYAATQAAWETLGDPACRAAHDASRGLAAGRRHVQVQVQLRAAEMGSEEYGGEACLVYPCRCGDLFLLPLSDLGAPGELVLVPCSSCSLFAQVQT